MFQNLENIDDDLDAVGIAFVKTDDAEFAAEMGVKKYPSLVYFELGNPSLYDGK